MLFATCHCDFHQKKTNNFFLFMSAIKKAGLIFSSSLYLMGQVFAEVLFCHVNITTAPCGFLPSVICSVTGNQGALWQRRQLESCKGAEWTVVAFKPLLVALPGHTGTRVLAEVHFSTCSLLMSFKGRRARPAPAVIFFFFFLTTKHPAN